MDELPEVTDAGLNDAVAPDGRPLADRKRSAPNRRSWRWIPVAVSEEPAVTEPEVGDTETEKSLVGVPEQVASPDWAGTGDSPARPPSPCRTRCRIRGSRFFAAFSVATRMLA